MSTTPRYYQADEPRSSSTDRKEEHNESHFQRPHRDGNQLELGVTEIAEGRLDVQRQVATSGGLAASQFRARWQTYRPEWVSAFVAEFFGVFYFTIMGTMSTAVYIFGAAEGQPGLASIFQIGLAYALGITFAIVVGAMSSGGHFHPAITLCQVVFKGFPLKKAPMYIFAQLLGGFCAALVTYLCNREPIQMIDAGLRLAGKEAQIYSAAGPAGIIALFPVAGRSYGTMFANEFFANLVIGLVIWACLDAQNIFVSPTVVPFTIGLVYATVVWGFITGGIALNTARDLGARFACGAIWGSKCFPPKYTALAALTNILATFCAVAIYTFLLSDSRRPPAPIALGHLMEEEKQMHLHATRTHEELMERKGADGSGGLIKRMTTSKSNA
ncbi:unnamed protein product [Parajaminaea phylloscopi]